MAAQLEVANIAVISRGADTGGDELAAAVDSLKSPYLLAVGNGGVSGSIAKLSLATCINDGLLDIVIVPDVSLTQLMSIGDWVMRGGELDSAENVMAFHAPRLDVESEGLQINLDGQPFVGDSFHFGMVEGALPFFMPIEPKPAFLR